MPPLVFDKAIALGPEPGDVNHESNGSDGAEDDQLHTPWGLIAASKRTEGGGGEPL